MADNRKIASVEDFKKNIYATITLTDYDAYGDKYDLDVVVKKLAMTALATEGVIPNTLMQKAMSLKDPNRNKETNKPEKEFDGEMIKESLTAMRSIAKAILVEPKYEDVAEFLTDNHLGQLVQYVSGGVQSLEKFRNEQESLRHNYDSSGVQV